MNSPIRIFFLALGLLGALLFGAAFITSLLNPNLVEETAKELIRRQVEKKVHEKIDAIDDKFLVKSAGRFVKGYGDEIAGIKRLLKDKAPERLAGVIAEMRNLDCECRRKIETGLREGFQWQLHSATMAHERLTTLIRTRYMETAERLTREFRIFTATNALVFAMLGLAAFFKRGAGMQLLPPGIILVVAASITAYLYLFKQNWLHTIVFNDYVGFAYVGYMLIVFALLCDILFNRARISTRLLNFFLQVVGSSLHAVPC